MAEPLGASDWSIWNKNIGGPASLLGGQGGQAQYEMLNSKLVLLKIIEVQSLPKTRGKSLIIWKSYKVLFNIHYKWGGQSLIWKRY